jgi:hypothetical protein
MKSAARRNVIVIVFAFLFGTVYLHGQCPNTGETKVTKPKQGTGYYFFKFIGDSSFHYFLDGKKFSFNDQDNPGKTYIFIDDMAYEPILVTRSDVAEYVKSSKELDILSAQAKHQQDYFKKADPSMVITDYGPSFRKNPDGSDGRLFYLWKKESAPGKEPATQYLCSTLVKDGVVILSVMLTKPSVSEDEAFRQIEKYTSHFDVMSSDLCAKVLSAPSAP